MVSALIEDPMFAEMESAIKDLANSKAPGMDGILAEILKLSRSCDGLKRALFDLVLHIWVSE